MFLKCFIGFHVTAGEDKISMSQFGGNQHISNIKGYFSLFCSESHNCFQAGSIGNVGVALLPSLKPSALDLTLNINFGHIWDRHHLNVRCTDPYVSYFASGLTSTAALLDLA